MCVIAEGARIAGEDGNGEGDIAKPAIERADTGIGHRLGRAITQKLGVGAVIQELAYLMRSGEPDAMDRMVGFAFGGLAVQLIERGETGRMVTLSDGKYSHVPIDSLLQGRKSVDVTALYHTPTYPPPP